MRGRAVDYKSLGAKKILVAEDVELNQYVARHMLESWNLEVSIANNGFEALQLMQEHSYDCILMDVQMPEMDGIEATRKIRRLSDPTKANIPIIALTANVLAVDRQRYFDAGMNDIIAKPFDESGLFSVLKKNLLPSSPAVDPWADHGSGQSQQNQRPLQEKLYDLSMVKAVSGGDDAFIRKMVLLFIETVPQNVQELIKSLQAQNWVQVSKMAHKLKSTIDSMGINSLHQVVRTVEANAKQLQDLDQVPDLVYKIDAVIERCIEQLRTDLL